MISAERLHCDLYADVEAGICRHRLASTTLAGTALDPGQSHELIAGTAQQACELHWRPQTAPDDP
jgi:hypothetical protein